MTSYSQFLAGLSVSLIALAAPAFAHHPGAPGNAGGAGPINTMSATTLPQGVSVVAVTYERIGLDSLSDETLEHAAEHAHDEHAHVHSLDSISSAAINYSYGLTRDLMVTLRLPYVSRTGIREGHFEGGAAEVHDHGDADGIGDASALAQWRFMNNGASGTSAAFVLGVKAPTGKTDETDGEGERLDTEFQPGSGSWDGMFGLAMTQRLGAWSLDGSVLYTVVGEGSHDTDLGDRFYYNVAVSYRLLGAASGPMGLGNKDHDHSSHKHGPAGHAEAKSSGPALDLVLELNGEWQDKQEADGEADGNSGGHTLYIAPGLRLSQDQWSGFASVGIPIVNELNGVQAEPDWRLNTGVSVGF